MNRLLFLFSFLLSFNCLRAQVFTHAFSSGHIHVVATDSMYHDSTACTGNDSVYYSITIDSSYVGDSVRVVDTINGIVIAGPFVNYSGGSPWSFNTTFWTMRFHDSQVAPGGGNYYFFYGPTKVVSRLDTLRYVAFEDSAWMLPCLWGDVSGVVYIDNNSNCIFDAGDSVLTFNPPYFFPLALENLSSPGVPTMSTGGGGASSGPSYWLTLQKSWLINYTVSLPSSLAFIFPTSPCFTGPYMFTTLPQTGVDFPLQCTSNVDVQCNLLSTGRVRLYDPFFVHPYVSNTGCDTMSGTMTMVKDHRTIYDAALSTHPADMVYGDTLIWNYAHLSNLSAGAYWNSFMSDVYLTQDATVVAGDTLCFRVYTNIPPTDVNPYNNDYTVCMPVVYSFDPNSKDVSPTGPGGQLPPNTSTLTYTLNFQNTGSDYAQNVMVIDTLDSNLDPKSLKILGASANMTPQWLAANVVEFYFENIMLPDSTHNEPASHGQVQFSINLKAGVPAGTTIRNTGYIYFDANPAVVTNTTTSVTSLPSAVPQVAPGQELKVYPNPATDELNIENCQGGTLVIMDMSGAVLLLQPAVSNKTTVSIANLPAGVYMLKATNNANTSTIKFTKY